MEASQFAKCNLLLLSEIEDDGPDVLMVDKVDESG
jgi:hypothetical protein